jgi:hypothetical protein
MTPIKFTSLVLTLLIGAGAAQANEGGVFPHQFDNSINLIHNSQ